MWRVETRPRVKLQDERTNSWTEQPDWSRRGRHKNNLFIFPLGPGWCLRTVPPCPICIVVVKGHCVYCHMLLHKSSLREFAPHTITNSVQIEIGWLFIFLLRDTSLLLLYFSHNKTRHNTTFANNENWGTLYDFTHVITKILAFVFVRRARSQRLRGVRVSCVRKRETLDTSSSQRREADGGIKGFHEKTNYLLLVK